VDGADPKRRRLARGRPALLAVTLAALSCAALSVIGHVPAADASGGGSQCQPLAAAAATPSPSASVTPTQPPVQLCVSVQPSESSVGGGQAAGFTVQVQAENGAAPDVSVTLTASAGQAVFTGLCPSGDGTASCQLGPLGTDVTPSSFTLDAQIGTPSSGASSVTLTASADAATSPPMTTQAVAAGAVTVTAVPATSSSKPAPSPSSPRAATSAPATALAVPPTPAGLPTLAPIPTIDPVSSSLVVAGNISSMLPVITPSPAPSPAVGTAPLAGTQSALALTPQADSQAGRADGSASRTSRLTTAGAGVFGLLALVLASLLVVTRVPPRRRRPQPVPAQVAEAPATSGGPVLPPPAPAPGQGTGPADRPPEPRAASTGGSPPRPGEFLG